MKIKNLLPFILAFVLAGCVPIWSLHPLYDDQHLVFVEKLLGTFEANEVTWEFARANEPNYYLLTYTAASKDDPNILKGFFDVHLVKLENNLFMDVYPKEGPWGNEKELYQTKWPANAFFMMPVHTFIKIEILESELKIRMSDDDNLKKLLKADSNAVKHELVNNTPVLTSPTRELQSFVLKYTDQIFNAEVALARKTSKPITDANEPNAPTPSPKDANKMPI